MGEAAAQQRISYADYVKSESTTEIKHEYVDGAVYAMAGGTPEHGALAAAWIRHLGNALQGRPCRVFSSDVRVTVSETGLSTYPDLTVVCGRLETHPDDRLAIINPVVIVEVLFDSTEAWDRGEKAAHYRRLSTLREYVLVSQHRPRIEVHRRTARGTWEIVEARAGETIDLPSIGVSIDVDAIYKDPLADAELA